MKAMKIIFKALFGMHLWLPIAYSVIFLVIAAIAETLPDSWPYYFIGLSLSFAASLGLVFYASERARLSAPKTQETAKPGEKTKQPRQPIAATDYESTEDAAARIRDEQMKYSQAMKANPSGGISGAKFADRQDGYVPPKAEPFMHPQAMQQYYGDAVRPETTAQSAHDTLYPSFTNASGTAAEQKGSFSPYVQPSNVAAPQSANLNDYNAERLAHREEPKIYRTRKEPNVLIYEYSDSIEKYYMAADGTLTFLSTETKS